MASGENHSSGTGTLDPVEVGYLAWEPEGSPVSIHMSTAVAEGIAADAAAGKDKEVGGLLLGRAEIAERTAVWIDRYQPISCAHTAGAEFVLDSTETAALEAAAGSILAAGQYAVVGLYRSQINLGFSLRDADLELVRRYFGDPSDLILLVKPGSDGKVTGLFHTWDGRSGARSVGAAVTLRKGASPEAPAERPRRLVPDFAPTPVEPAPSVFGLSDPPRPRPLDTTTEQVSHGHLRRWLPLVAALGLVGGVGWFFVQQAWHPAPNAATAAPAAEVARPIGLFVDASAGNTWRVSWNPNATALHNARNVRLFVRERNGQSFDDPADGDQSPVVSASDLAAGSYEYRPRGNDVTFRLEVTDQSGRLTAESFRLVRTPAAVSAPGPAPASSPKPEPPVTRTHLVQPKATYKAPAVVAAGIRSRIKGVVPVDVRVEIDTHGRVVSATPVTKTHSGIDSYLASRALQAAKQWRFEPAREDGKAVAGSQILHFVFEK